MNFPQLRRLYFYDCAIQYLKQSIIMLQIRPNVWPLFFIAATCNHFNVQKGKDGIDFEVIGSLQAMKGFLEVNMLLASQE
jgi:hypothetical protein